MVPKQTESCGRCSMTGVVGLLDDEDGDRDPFGGARIEVPEEQMRAVAAPQVLLGRVTRRIDEVATRVTYGN